MQLIFIWWQYVTFTAFLSFYSLSVSLLNKNLPRTSLLFHGLMIISDEVFHRMTRKGTKCFTGMMFTRVILSTYKFVSSPVSFFPSDFNNTVSVWMVLIYFVVFTVADSITRCFFEFIYTLSLLFKTVLLVFLLFYEANLHLNCLFHSFLSCDSLLSLFVNCALIIFVKIICD